MAIILIMLLQWGLFIKTPIFSHTEKTENTCIWVDIDYNNNACLTASSLSFILFSKEPSGGVLQWCRRLLARQDTGYRTPGD